MPNQFNLLERSRASGALETWDRSSPAGSRGRAPGGGLGAKPPEAERLSGHWRVMSTLNLTLQVIPSGNWATSMVKIVSYCPSFVNRNVVIRPTHCPALWFNIEFQCLKS